MNGQFVTGFQFRADWWKEDTDLVGGSAVCLKCEDNEDVCSKMGPFGRWGKLHQCPKGSYISGWRQAVEAGVGGGFNGHDDRCK